MKFWSVSINHTQYYGGPTYGTQYDMKRACSLCGTGAEIDGPLVLSGLKVPKRPVFANLDREIIIADSFVEILKNEGINTFGNIVAKKDLRELPFKWLKCQCTLSPFDFSTTGFKISEKKQCEDCKRDGYFNIPHIPLLLRYKNVNEEILNNDVLCTYECFGLSALREPFKDSVFASPKYIISDKLKNILEKNKATRCMSFTPVIFE